MFGVQQLDSSDACAIRELVERRIALAESDCAVLCNRRQNLTKTPDTTLINLSAGGSPLTPECLEFGGIQTGSLAGVPRGKGNFQQIAALGTAQNAAQALL